MKEVEIQLLIKDLCARLPYGVKCLVNFDDGTNDIMTLQTGLPNSYGTWSFCNENCSAYSDNFKPYLRPMETMTKEEHEEFFEKWGLDGWNIDTFDWLNARQFDYRGLIPMGLALKASEDMYK